MQLQSGEWTGYYRQCGNQTEQKMVLEFADGLIRGDGIDKVSPFTIEGEYRLVETGYLLGWIKTYEYGHSILYRGKLNENEIIGEWEILRLDTDEFKLHPSEHRV